MVPLTRRAALVVSVLFLTAVPRHALAERLLVAIGGTPSAHRGIARVQTLALDTAGLASLRASTEATLEEFPLGSDGSVTLAVARFSPFAADTRVELVEATRTRSLSLPDQEYYRGSVVGEAGSRAVVIATRDAVRGIVVARGTTYRFGPDGTGVYRSWAVRDADPAVFPPPLRLCSNDLHAAVVQAHPGRAVVPDGAAAEPPILGYSPTLLAELAIETDEEFLGLFPGTDEALDYLSSLAAEVSTIYDADTDVRIVFRFIRLWSTSDPWSANGDTLDMLTELKAYWEANEAGTPRDLVHFVSGKGVIGGIAYLNVLCNNSFGYGVSTVYGSFDLMDPSDIWDVEVVAHELGHNFGSVHTHCYVPPIDECYNGEADIGCYSGPESLPPGGGTIMSYCHLLSGGMANINLTFDTSGTVVSDVLRAGAVAGICIGPPCGDGILDAGEDCDDGNITNGDCCSSTCTAEADGGGCDDDEDCTSSDQCTSGVCAGTPVVDGTPCDDGSVCTTDSCQAGACVGLPAPAPGCKLPTLPAKAQLQMKDKSPDKGDQVKFKWTKGALTTLAEFGAPLTSDAYQLCVYEAGPAILVSSTAPPGGICDGKPCWKVVGGGFKYKDKLSTPNGMAKVQLKEGAAGAAKVQAQAKGVPLEMPALGSLSLPLRAQLRGPGGVCFEATFSTPIKNDSTQFKAKSD